MSLRSIRFGLVLAGLSGLAAVRPAGAVEPVHTSFNAATGCRLRRTFTRRRRRSVRRPRWSYCCTCIAATGRRGSR